MGKLFLIPNTLGDSNIHGVLPSEVIARIKNIKIFASENPKNTRRFLKQIDKSIVLEELTFLELNEHSDRKAVEACLPYLEKEDVGIISEAGCPGIADPGAGIGRFSPSESDSSCAAGRSIVDFVGFNRFGL